jgi:hypothetical protein
MEFTLKALLPPFVCFVLFGLLRGKGPLNNSTGPLGVLIVMWGFVAFCIVVVYWIARIWKRATRDSPDLYGRH